MAAGRMRRMVLPTSLILNLFLVALVGGHFLRLHHEQNLPMLAHALATAEDVLDASDATAFRETLQAEAPRYTAEATTLAQSRDTLDERIAAPHFDRNATRAALLAWRADWLQFTDAFAEPMMDALAKLSPDGRRRLIAERRKDAPALKTP